MLQPIVPVSVGGFGSISLSGTSVAISSCTTIAPSSAFPSILPAGAVTLWNSIDSAGNVYVNPISTSGTVAATTSCIPLAPGQSQMFAITQGQTPTAISNSTATLLVIW